MAADKDLRPNALLTAAQSVNAFGAMGTKPNALLAAAQSVNAFGELGTKPNAFLAAAQSVNALNGLGTKKVTSLPQKSDTTIRSASDLGQKISEARKHMNMTQQAFADLAGVGRRFLSELEAGKPTLEFERVLRVCQAAGIDLLAVKR